ncbi:unnamed protein product [Phytophthora lilii]|uniref:Unnamed protein product n=1 Tax=Phytophthora lilii TaxID=2077276 RepID=A0A9W6TZ03_9STRA|nr:unnamed protein product [Phytophthora lilii]
MNSAIVEFGMSNTLLNKGAYERSLFTALDQNANHIALDVMGGSANLQSVSKPQVYVPAAGAVASGAPISVAHYLASALTTTGLAVPASTILTVTADVNDTPTAGTGITPLQSFSRLLVPTYTPDQSADHALAQKKTFRYFERITNKFTVASGAYFTWTVSNVIANPKRLIMQPIITNPTAGAIVSDLINPFRSPFSTVPSTTSPFAALKNLQTSWKRPYLEQSC